MQSRNIDRLYAYEYEVLIIGNPRFLPDTCSKLPFLPQPHVLTRGLDRGKPWLSHESLSAFACDEYWRLPLLSAWEVYTNAIMT